MAARRCGEQRTDAAETPQRRCPLRHCQTTPRIDSRHIEHSHKSAQTPRTPPLHTQQMHPRTQICGDVDVARLALVRSSSAGAIDNTAGPDPEDESERAAPPPPEFRRSTGARPGSDELGKSSLRQCRGPIRARPGATSANATWHANAAPVVAVLRCSRQCEPAADMQTQRCRTAAHAGAAGSTGERSCSEVASHGRADASAPARLRRLARTRAAPRCGAPALRSPRRVAARTLVLRTRLTLRHTVFAAVWRGVIALAGGGRSERLTRARP